MSDEVKEFTGEERIDALCAFLKEKHGFHFPLEVFNPEKDDPFKKSSGIDGDAGGWTEYGDGLSYPAEKPVPVVTEDIAPTVTEVPPAPVAEPAV